MTRFQCRAARALLDWDQRKLAAGSEVSLAALKNFERGSATPIRATMNAMRAALEAGGIQFIPEDEHGGPGLRLRRDRQL